MSKTTHHDQRADRLLRIREAADVLAVSQRSIWLYFERGILEPVKLGGATRVRQSDLDRIIREGLASREEPTR